MSECSTRRQFLQATSAGLLAAGYTSTSWAASANDTLNIGCIGTGGRSRQLMGNLRELPGAKLVAVCDVWDQHREQGRELCESDCKVFTDYRKLLEETDIDAVVIGAPDHWHVPMTIDACAAGKDVYVEKPLTHDVSEGAAVIKAQNDSQRIVQVGMQQRSMPHIQQANELIRAGHIGDVHKVHLSWNRNAQRGSKKDYGIDPKSVDWQRFLGNAPEQPFDGYRFRNWRWFWDFGGGIFTDLMVHWIDVAHWILETGAPQQAASIGDHFTTKGIWETPDTVQTILKYPENGVQAYFEGTFFNARNRAMIEFMGTKGTIYIDRGRYEVHPDPHQDLEASELVLGTEPRGADFFANPNGTRLHLANWLECCRTRKTPNAPVEVGVTAAAAAHLANQSLRTGKMAFGRI
ncbi:MAG: Gfo/Idh/MocA family oxidoreductase [Planctomycetaceae bacterium]|nr:Gfo/Idh/MocA family oxidoreductase [Planctomycetaceae bacterium]